MASGHVNRLGTFRTFPERALICPYVLDTIYLLLPLMRSP